MATGHWRTVALRKSLASPLPHRPGFGVNELFHRCLADLFLKELAKNPNSNRTLSFERALKSLAAFPRPLRDGMQAVKEVNMIGEKLGLLLQKALEKERLAKPNDPDLNAGVSPRRQAASSLRSSPGQGSSPSPRRAPNEQMARSPTPLNRQSGLNLSPGSPESSPRSRARVPAAMAGSKRTSSAASMVAPNAKKSKAPRTGTTKNRTKAYTPGVYTGGWALVMALLHMEATAPGGEGLFAAVETWQPDESVKPSKNDLQKLAAMLCRSSFELSYTGDNPYTAWNSMSTLKSKGMVQTTHVRGKGQVFGLTALGRALAVRLAEDYSARRSEHEAKILADDRYELDLTQVWHLVKQVLSVKHHQDALDVICSQDHDDLRSSGGACSDVVDLLSSDSEDDTTTTIEPRAVERSTMDAPLDKKSKVLLKDEKIRLPEHRLKQWPDVPFPSLLPRSGQSMEVILLMDLREMTGAGKKKQMEGLLRSVGVKYEQRNLHLGDMMWIVRQPGTSGEESELVLDYVVERKTVADLVASVTDGRYEEQKYRLRKQKMVRQVIYILEGNISEARLKKSGCPFATTTLRKLLHKAQVEDGFSVRRTMTGKATAEYLRTCFLTSLPHLHSLCRREDLTFAVSLTKHLRRRCEGASWAELQQRHPVMSFVQEATRKATQLKYRDLFAKQLLKMKYIPPLRRLALLSLTDRARRCSPIVAKAVVTKYGCPRLLHNEYETSDLSEEKKAQMLKNFPLGVNNRKVGVVLSKRIYSMFDDYEEGDYEDLSQGLSLSIF